MELFPERGSPPNIPAGTLGLWHYHDFVYANLISFVDTDVCGVCGYVNVRRLSMVLVLPGVRPTAMNMWAVPLLVEDGTRAWIILDSYATCGSLFGQYTVRST